MTATNHALTGAVIALIVKQPALAIPFAFVSHFVLDAIPHFDASKASVKFARAAIFTDILVAGCLAFGLSIVLRDRVSGWLILAASVACMSPDLVWGVRYYKFRDFKKIISEPMSKFTKLHQKIQWSESLQGIIVEFVWFALMLVLVINTGN